MNNMRNRILSLLVLLMTAATGAWAGIIIDVADNFPAPAGTVACTTADEGKVLCTDGTIYPTVALATEAGKTAAAKIIVVDPYNKVGLALALGNESSKMSWQTANNNASAHQPAVNFGGVWTLPNRYQWEKMIGSSYTDLANGFTSVGGTNMVEGTYWSSTSDPGDGNNAFIFYGSFWDSHIKNNAYSIRYCLFFNVEEPIAVDPVTDAASTWQFKMPGGKVEFSLVFTQATILDTATGDVVRSYATLQEAFDAVQTGQTIQLDEDVTVTEGFMTSSAGDGVKFKLDFNGYTIIMREDEDLTTVTLLNSGDRLTFTDSSEDQAGGFNGRLVGEAGSQYVFEAGNYYIGDDNAATLNAQCAAPNYKYQLAENKWFVDIENDPNGFKVRVEDMGFWVTIPAGEYVTYYSDKPLKLLATETDAALYTITGVTGSTATAKAITVASSKTPLLVYNSGDTRDILLQITKEPATATSHYPGFKGTLSDYTIPASSDPTNFAFNGKQFVIVRTPLIVPANHAYLEVTNTTARAITVVFQGETTSIDNGQWTINNSDGTVYDLQGRKMVHGTSSNSTLKKGVYVKDGNKVVIK